MTSFKQYRSRIDEGEFDVAKAIKDATTWLKNKYGEDMYSFKHIENMDMGQVTKTYDITVGDSEYRLDLRKFDTAGTDQPVVGFMVSPVTHPEDEDEEL